MVKRCAVALLFRENQILLGKRSCQRKFYPNVWDLVGGHCEEGETPEQALVRELREEIGITPTQFQCIGILGEPNSHLYGEYAYDVFLVLGWEGIPCNNAPHEHAEIRWFAIPEAVSLELAHPQYPEIFRTIANS